MKIRNVQETRIMETFLFFQLYKVNDSYQNNDSKFSFFQRFVYCHLHADDDDEAGEKSKKKRMQDAIRSARRNMAAKTRDKPAIK